MRSYCTPLVLRFDVITGILSFLSVPASNPHGAHVAPFHRCPPATEHTAAGMHTPRPALTKQGQCGHCCPEKDCCCQSKAEASHQNSCSLKLPPGYICFHTCSQDAELKGVIARTLAVLLGHTSLTSVLYLPVLSSLKSSSGPPDCDACFLPAAVGSKSCPHQAVLRWQA